MANYDYNPGQITVSQAIWECANKIVNAAVQMGSIPAQIGNAVIQRVQQEMQGLCNYVSTNFVRNGAFDDNELSNWLKDLFNNWSNEIAATMQPMGYNNYGYNGYPNNYNQGYMYNNGFSARPQFGTQINPNFVQAAQFNQPVCYNQNFQQYNGGMRFDPRMASAPIMGNMGNTNTSMMGIGSALGRQALNNQVQQTSPINPVEQVAQTYTNNNNNTTVNQQQNVPTSNNQAMEVAPATEYQKPLNDHKESALFMELKDSIRKTLNNRKHRLKNVDKLTSNDTEILIGDYVVNKVFSEETAIVDNRNEPSLSSSIKTNEVAETIEGINHLHSSSISDKFEDDTSFDMVDVTIPMNSATEAFEFVKNNVRGLNSGKNFYLQISYDELTARKLPNDGIITSNVFDEVSDKIAKLDDNRVYDGIVEYFMEEIMPIIRKAPEAGRAYLEKLIYNKFNDLFDRTCTVPYNHDFRPDSDMTTPGQISAIMDAKDNVFSEYMHKYFGTDYTDAVKSCLFKALKSIFYNESVDIDSPVSKGLLAHAAELYSVNYGRYRISDYGVMPEDSLKTMLNKIKRDYIVHTTKKNILITNVDVNEYLPDAEYVYISNDAKIHEIVINIAMEQLDAIEDISVLTVDKHSCITSSMKPSKLLDGTILIKRI